MTSLSALSRAGASTRPRWARHAVGILVLGGLGGVVSCGEASRQPDGPLAILPLQAVFTRSDSVELRTEERDPVGQVASVVRWGEAIAIADAYQRNVKVFDGTGALRRTIGRVGDGPGEFRSPASLGVLTDGRLAVVDEGRGMLSLFDTSGTFHRSVRLPGIGSGPITMLRDGGRFVMPASLRTDSAWAVDGLYVVDTAGVITDTLGHVERPMRPMQGSINYLSATAVGRSVAWIPMRDNTLHVRHADGRREGPMRVGEAVYRPVAWPDRPLGAGEKALQWMRSQMWAAGISALDSAHVLVRLSTGGEGASA
jgi:hypothetical protein